MLIHIHKIKAIVISVLFASSLSFSVLQAAEAEYQVFCDKLKICMVENIKSQGSYQQGMEKFIDVMVEEACQTGLTQYQMFVEESKNDEGMKAKTATCLDSFLESSCEEMLTSIGKGESVTPECKDAEAYANEKGYSIQ